MQGLGLDCFILAAKNDTKAMLITFYTIAVCDVKRLLVQFQARWCPATVTPSSVRLTPGTVASVSLP